jgi:CRP-like cAMP-binding protein
MRKGPFILATLRDTDVYWMQTCGKTQQISAGTVLIEEGTSLDTFYIVLVGLLSVSITAKGNQEVARLGIGEILGEMSFVDARPSAAKVTALQDSLVLSIPHQRLAEKLEQDDGFAARFYRAIATFLSSRLRSTVVQFDCDEDESLVAPPDASS